MFGNSNQIQDTFKYITVYSIHFILWLNHLPHRVQTLKSGSRGPKMNQHDWRRTLNVLHTSHGVQLGPNLCLGKINQIKVTAWDHTVCILGEVCVQSWGKLL